MPVYEYLCSSCLERYEQLRAMREADAPATCPHCGNTQARRLLPSSVAAMSGGRAIAGFNPCGGCSAASTGCRVCPSVRRS